MSTPRKSVTKSSKATGSHSLSVVKRDDGRFVIGGTDERKLVSRDAKVPTKSAPHSTRRLSDFEIKAFAKRMKVAA